MCRLPGTRPRRNGALLRTPLCTVVPAGRPAATRRDNLRSTPLARMCRLCSTQPRRNGALLRPPCQHRPPAGAAPRSPLNRHHCQPPADPGDLSGATTPVSSARPARLARMCRLCRTRPRRNGALLRPPCRHPAGKPPAPTGQPPVNPSQPTRQTRMCRLSTSHPRRNGALLRPPCRRPHPPPPGDTPAGGPSGHPQPTRAGLVALATPAGRPGTGDLRGRLPRLDLWRDAPRQALWGYLRWASGGPAGLPCGSGGGWVFWRAGRGAGGVGWVPGPRSGCLCTVDIDVIFGVWKAVSCP
ncbi:hypothetical protein Br6_04801 [Rhodococcus sp. Br-6]|nr:hypothetical protein Br6_04801 [Rhodococcus sp. Br-6]